MNEPTQHNLTPQQQLYRFWFTPMEPTTLGFMRIITGLLILYIHAVYSLDLQAYFGKYGFYSWEAAEIERKEAPTTVTPMFGRQAWDTFVPMAQLPIYPHRQQAVMEFLRAVSPDATKRKEQLAFLIRLQNELLRPAAPQRDPVTGLDILDMTARTNWPERKRIGAETIEFLTYLYTSPKLRAPQLDAYVNPALRTPKERMPSQFLLDLHQEGPNSRTTVRDEIEALMSVMPSDTTARRYVFDHLLETGLENRHQLVDFLLKLSPDDAIRTKQLNFLEHWNTDASRAYRLGTKTFSLWYHITDPTEMAIAHGVVLVIMFLFTIGLWTRVTSVLTWIAAVSYIHRTQQVLFGMDTMMNLLLIYLMIGNSGGALSVDRLIARYRASKNSIGRTGKIDEATREFLQTPPKTVASGFALRMLQTHFCIIYFIAGISKLKGGTWWNTTAAWDTMSNPEFTLIHFDWYIRIMRWVVQERMVFAAASGLMVVFTFVVEIGFPFLIWTRLRPYMIVLACLFHLGIGCMMGLNLFGLLMMTLIFSYIPGRAIRDCLVGGSNLKPVTIQFDPKNESQVRAASTTIMADLEGQVRLEAKEKAEYRMTSGSESYQGSAIASQLFRILPLLRMGSLAGFLPWIRKRFSA